jgi:hypothetical protein
MADLAPRSERFCTAALLAPRVLLKAGTGARLVRHGHGLCINSPRSIKRRFHGFFNQVAGPLTAQQERRIADRHAAN